MLLLSCSLNGEALSVQGTGQSGAGGARDYLGGHDLHNAEQRPEQEWPAQARGDGLALDGVDDAYGNLFGDEVFRVACGDLVAVCASTMSSWAGPLWGAATAVQTAQCRVDDGAGSGRSQISS